MVLSDVSVKRPVFATVVSLLIVVFGISALMKLPIREYPDIDLVFDAEGYARKDGTRYDAERPA